MAVPSTELAKDPRALTAIAQWATRDDKPDAKARRTAAINAMRLAGAISPEEYEAYPSMGASKQVSRWKSGYYLKKFAQVDSSTLNLYSNWYKLLYPPAMQISLPGIGQIGFAPPTVNPDDQGMVPETGEPAPEGAMPPLDPPPTPSRGMGPFLLAAGGLLALVKILGK